MFSCKNQTVTQNNIPATDSTGPELTIFSGKSGCLSVLQKLMLVRFCVVVWALFGVFSKSFGDCIHPQHQETTRKVNCLFSISKIQLVVYYQCCVLIG